MTSAMPTPTKKTMGSLSPFLSIPALLVWEALRPVLLTGALAITVGVYALMLHLASRLLGERREQIIEALKTVR